MNGAGGILTVADDLLKNDGQKFLEMMEQLADKRIQRERDIVPSSTAHAMNSISAAAARDARGQAKSEEGSYDEDEDE